MADGILSGDDLVKALGLYLADKARKVQETVNASGNEAMLDMATQNASLGGKQPTEEDIARELARTEMAEGASSMIGSIRPRAPKSFGNIRKMMSREPASELSATPEPAGLDVEAMVNQMPEPNISKEMTEAGLDTPTSWEGKLKQHMLGEPLRKDAELPKVLRREPKGPSQIPLGLDYEEAVARSALKDLAETGGFSRMPSGRKVPSGYMVAKDKLNEEVLGSNVPSDELKSRIVEKLKLASKEPNTAVGGWQNEGQTYLDLAENTPWVMDALKKGELRDQKAIFDLNKFREIPVKKPK